MAGNEVTGYGIAASINTTDVLYLIQNGADRQLSMITLFGAIPTPVSANTVFILGGTAQSINNSGTIQSTQNVTVLSNDSVCTLAIDNGVYQGQVKLVLFSSGSHTSTISGSNLFSNIVLSVVGSSVLLFWQGTYWWNLSG